MPTAFMLPWKTSGDRSGPQQAWQCLQCRATAGSQTFDITAYQAAVRTTAGDEFFIFSFVVYQPEPGSVDNGTASVTTTSLRGFKATSLSQRGHRAEVAFPSPSPLPLPRPTEDRGSTIQARSGHPRTPRDGYGPVGPGGGPYSACGRDGCRYSSLARHCLSIIM